jgi:hypothetical protein
MLVVNGKIQTEEYNICKYKYRNIHNVFHQLNALVIKTLKYSKTV